MKRLILNLATVLLLAAAFLQAGFKSTHKHNTSYTGEIMNGSCAGQSSHNQNQEMAREGAKNATDCPICRKDGARLVLYSA